MTSAAQSIRDLFASQIDRRIEEVIKVDQTDAQIVREEIDEYVVTSAIRAHYVRVMEAYAETPNRPHEGIAVWVSGFFGSGKSSFAKMLGLAIEDRDLGGTSAADLFAMRAGYDRLTVVLKQIGERIPTHGVVFDVSTDTGIKSGNQKLTEIMYRQLLGSLGYARDLDLSELEIALETEGRLDDFKAAYRERHGKDWDQDKSLIAFSLGRASEVMSILEPATYPQADSWVKGAKDRADITPGKLAERCRELMDCRYPGESLVFVIDEVGQFVARDVQKMLDLQGIVQSLGRVGRGKDWVVVTSQEKLGELVSGLDDKRIELARLMDRFPQQVHLEPSDISEVTSRRVLTKHAAAQSTLGQLFDDYRAKLTTNTKVSADVTFPELSRQGFIDLYPLLPYQVDLIIAIVSGLRTQGGSSKHVGGAARTVIKLAQQVLIHPSVGLADQAIGQLVRLDHIYDLVEGNVGSDVRAKIASIPSELMHPLAAQVAKAICLLQFVKSVHRTPENIAATLYPQVGADSQLASVKEALQELEAAQKVRRGDDGYRIPSPAEDDWERLRSQTNPKPGDTHRIHTEAVTSFWQPQPQHLLEGAKLFKAGLAIGGREVIAGDVRFELHFADEPGQLDALAEELRTRSQTEKQTVFWAAALNDTIDRNTVEVHRSRDILSRKEREARTADEAALVAEERQRLGRHEGDLRRTLKDAIRSGAVYFRGNDRSPGEQSVDVGKVAAAILETVLPDVFTRFGQAAAKTNVLNGGMEALLKAADLQGLPAVFRDLGLVRDENGKTVFEIDQGSLRDVMARIEERENYSETVSGRYLAEEFAKEPYGWEYEAVRLFALCLLRAGLVEVTSKAQTFDAATGPAAVDTFSSNPVFRLASFRRKKGADPGDIVIAAEAFRNTFGHEVRELSELAVVAELREAIADTEESVVIAVQILNGNNLPGTEVLESALDQIRSIRRGSSQNAIATFNATHASIKEAKQRTVELENALNPAALKRLADARQVLGSAWLFLEREADIDSRLAERAEMLSDLLERETFFTELPAIDQHTKALEGEYQARYDHAVEERTTTYQAALEQLRATLGWPDLEPEVQEQIAAPLERLAGKPSTTISIPQLRSELKACPVALAEAVEAVYARGGTPIEVISLASYFAGGVDTNEQLEEALKGVREACERIIGAGRKVVVK